MRFPLTLDVAACFAATLAPLGALWLPEPQPVLAATVAVSVAAALLPGGAARAWPWPLLVVVAVALCQSMPIPAELWPRLSPARAEIFPILTQRNIPLESAVSLTPVQSLSDALLAAACASLFALARSGTARAPRAALAVLVVLAAGVAVESVLGARGYFWALYAETPSEPATGSFVSRSHFAAYLLAGFGVALGMTLARTWRERLVGAGALALIAPGLVLSHSRAGVLLAVILAVVTVTVGLLRAGRGAAVAVLIGLALSAAVAAPFAKASLTERFEELVAESGDPGRRAVWSDSWRLLDVRAPLGEGLGAFESVFRRSSVYFPRKTVDHAHNDYLELAVELGPIAAVLFVSMWLVAGNVFLRAVRDPSRPDSAVAFGCALGAAAVSAHALVDFPLRSAPIAALTAVLLGFGHGLVGRRGSPRAGARAATAVVAIALLAAGLASAFVVAPACDVEATFAQAQQAHSEGDSEQAASAYRRMLGCNPFSAASWLGLSSLARADGRPEDALELARIAEQVGPATLRTEWPLAELELLAGDQSPALARLGRMTEALPELAYSAYRLAWRSGADLDAIRSALAPPDGKASAEFLVFLVFLVRIEAWERIPGAYGALGRPVPKAEADYLLRELQAAGRTIELNALRRLGFPG